MKLTPPKEEVIPVKSNYKLLYNSRQVTDLEYISILQSRLRQIEQIENNYKVSSNNTVDGMNHEYQELENLSIKRIKVKSELDKVEKNLI